MSQNIKVSVLCCAFNHEQYIRDTLEGFVSQKTDFPFEVLVHDDASTDATADIIREYEEKYPEIIKPIYQTQNQHSLKIPIIRTFLVPKVKGKYIAFCEGDDYWTDPLKLQKQYDFLESHADYSMCTCSCIWLDLRNGKELNRCRTDVDRDVSFEEIVLEKKGRPFQFATYFLKTEYYINRPEWSKKFGVGDTPVAMHLSLCGKVRMLADVMAVYRNHAQGSWTSNIDKDTKRKTMALSRMIEGFTAFNEATKYEYDALISKRVHMIQYNIARTNRDLKAIRSGELKKIYKSKRILSRFSDVLICKAPRLHKMLRSVLGNE